MTDMIRRLNGRIEPLHDFEKEKRRQFCNKYAGKLTLGVIGLTGMILFASNFNTIKKNVSDYLTSEYKQGQIERVLKVKPHVLSIKQVQAVPYRGAEYYAHKQINKNPCIKSYFSKNDLTAYIQDINPDGFIKGEDVNIPDKWDCNCNN